MHNDANAPHYTFGESVPLLWKHGPISFGNMVAGAVVSWSTPKAVDLLISRCWEGVFLYPSPTLEDEAYSREPLKLLNDVEYLTRAFPVGDAGNGAQHLLITDRPGFLYRSEASGAFPDLAFAEPEVVRDGASGLPFNFPYQNDYVDGPSSQSGYIDPHFFCYVYPAEYRLPNDPGTHLIVGDVVGNLHWLRDHSAGARPPRYEGEAYTKPAGGIRYGVRYRERYGLDYARPRERICDEAGRPFLLGTPFDPAVKSPGGACRPIPLPSPNGTPADLLVLCAGRTVEIHFLRYAGMDDRGAPVFRNEGPVELAGFDTNRIGFHNPLFVNAADGGATILAPQTWKLAVLTRTTPAGEKPVYAFDRWLSAANAPACGYGFKEILTNPTGRRFLLDCPGHFELREIHGHGEGLRLDAEAVALEDQHGEFQVEGETDLRTSPGWGVHRAVRWRYDPAREAAQDLVVGTDKGLLYLLRAPMPAAQDEPPYRYESAGPLRDTRGAVIRVHNRVFPAGVPSDETGRRENLLLAAASYQMGIPKDPTPGAGFYLVRNAGTDSHGLPILGPPEPVRFAGWEPQVDMNQNFLLQAVDLDDDGTLYLIIGVPSDGYRGRVFLPEHGGALLRYTGRFVKRFRPHERLLDIDADGSLELVSAGGESGRGYYCSVHVRHQEE